MLGERIHTGRTKSFSKRPDYRTLNYNHSHVSTNNSYNPYGEHSGDVLKNFQDQLTSINSKLDTKNKAFRLKKELLRQDRKEQSDIRQKLHAIKNQLQVNKKKDDIERRLERIITEHSSSIERKKDSMLPRISQSMSVPPVPLQFRHPTDPYYIPSPQMSPYHQPFPLYPSYPSSIQSSCCKPFSSDEESDEEKEIVKPLPKARKNRKLVPQKNRYMSKQERQKNKERLRRIMKKCFRAVTYISYLKRLSKNIRSKRKFLFDKYWPQNFQKSTVAMRKWFSSNCKKFFEQMAAKKDLVINIQGDENDTVMLHKKKMIKGLITVLIQCLNNLVDDPAFEEICQIVVLFCKHGAFADNGVLTPEQAETVCFSQIHGNLRLNRSLEKSQIINFLFMKVILYNMLLQPWKYSSKFELSHNHQAYQNFFFISSVFYQILCDIQNEYLKESRDQSYKIGNYRSLKAKFKIKFCPPLVHLQNNYEEGEMISGLVPEEVLDRLFSPSFWRGETQLIVGIIDKMHEKMRKVHWKLINTIYNYKDMSKF